MELHQLTRWIDRAGGRVPAGFCSLSEDCSCNHPSVHPWLRLGFSIEHLACRKMFKKNGWYGSDINDQNGTRVTFKEENYYVPHTVRFSPLASLKFWNFCNSYSFGYFPGSHQKEIVGFRFIFSHVHEDFQHNVQSKRIPMAIFILTSLIRVFSLWVKLSVLGSLVQIFAPEHLLFLHSFWNTHFSFQSPCVQHSEFHDSGQRKGRWLFVYFKVLYKNLKRTS